jgi:malonyl-CoA O-methyltransferase
VYCEHKKKIKHCFNRAATTYDANSNLQFEIGSILIDMLKPQMQSSAIFIDLGCGTGKTTQQLTNTFTSSTCIAIDIAEQLIKIAQPRLATSMVSILQADFEHLPLRNNIADAVFSNMALHWSLNLKPLLNEVTRVLKPCGLLAFSIPIRDTFFELLASQQQLLKEQFIMDRFMTLDQLTDQLHNCGYHILKIKQSNYCLYFNSLLQLIKSIKQVGANHMQKSLANPLKPKSYLEKLEDFYSSIFGNRIKQLPLTYSIVYVIAQKI